MQTTNPVIIHACTIEGNGKGKPLAYEEATKTLKDDQLSLGSP